jgi:hypothetical protein
MPPHRRTGKDTPTKLIKRIKRRWRVVLLLAKGEMLGTVEAPDVASARAAAAVQFDLDEIQRNRIMVQELAERYPPRRSPDWLKFKNPEAPAVKREAEGDWGAMTIR